VEYFIAGIDRLEALARAHEGWNTAEENEVVLDSLTRARAVYQERRR
jgi:hypothetical protein